MFRRRFFCLLLIFRLSHASVPMEESRWFAFFGFSPEDAKEGEPSDKSNDPGSISLRESDLCNRLPKSSRITASHVQGDGIGYKDGYTSLEFFGASPYILSDCLIPFVDLRGYLLNDAMPAATGGAGLRFLTSRVWGLNGYYDYRKSHHKQYTRASLGLESLGKVWDFRINGYLPLGHKRSGFYDEKFDHTTGTTLFFSKTYEFDFKGANAEIGVHFKRNNYLPLYFAIGPYYLTGQGETSWGGSARLSCEIGAYFRLEGSTSYDALFGWTGQGRISLNPAFGFKKKKNCESRKFLFERATQRVDRQEMIPLKTAKVIFVD